MTRKRMKKLMMSLGLSRNAADKFSRASKKINAFRQVHPEAVSYESRLFEQRLKQYVVLRDILRNAKKNEEYRRRLWNAFRFNLIHGPGNNGNSQLCLDICPGQLEGTSPSTVLLDDAEHSACHSYGTYGIHVKGDW